MTLKKIVLYIAVFLFFACNTKKNTSEFIMTEPFPVEKILAKGTLDISTFYNTTDYYVYKGITKGFQYDLAKDFAEYLGVKPRIVEISDNVDSAITKLRRGDYDLVALSLTETPERKGEVNFSSPLFRTTEVLVQNIKNNPVKNLTELEGKEIFITRNATSKKILQQIQDSLHIQINVVEVSNYSYEDILHLIETGEIDYTVIDENIAQTTGISMRNLDYSTRLTGPFPVSWATNINSPFLIEEIDEWLKCVQKNGKLNIFYNRYFNNHKSVPHHKSKYALLKKGDISPFDKLLKKASSQLGWDWRLLAAIVYTESQFDPEAESPMGAYGLMQIIPETAGNFNVTDYFSPDSNVHIGMLYLKYLDNLFTQQGVDSTDKVKFILASYNAGAGHILDAMRLAEKYKKNPAKWDNNVDYYLLNKSKPEFYRDPVSKNGYCNGKQSYQYVQQVLETYNNYKNIRL